MQKYLNNNPASDNSVSLLLLHWATQIAFSLCEQGYEPSEVLPAAFGIANKMLLEQGLRVDGSNKLTRAGVAKEIELLTDKDAEEIENDYENLKSMLAV